MGIMDLLNPAAIEADKEARKKAAESARADPAAAMKDVTVVAPAPAPVEPALIPPGTPTPAVNLAEIEADRQARSAAAERAREDPAAFAAGVVEVPAPPEPKLIPPGTPTPAVSLEEIAADREARRLNAEALRASLAEKASAPGAAGEAAPALAPVAEAPAAEAPVISDQAPAAPLPPAEQMTQGQPIAMAEPTFAEKLNTVAKKRGRGFLDALQAGLYNFAGITKPTDYEKRVEAEAAETKDLLDKQWQQQMLKIQSDFQARQSEMDRDFSMAVAQAKNNWDVQAAKDAYAQQSKENKLDRQNNLDVANKEYQQQKMMTLDQIRQLIQSTYGGQ